MTDRDKFAALIRDREPFKHLELDRRFQTGEFVSLAAEMAFQGYIIAIDAAVAAIKSIRENEEACECAVCAEKAIRALKEESNGN